MIYFERRQAINRNLVFGSIFISSIIGCTHLEANKKDRQSKLHTEPSGEVCQKFGPQTPRNIDSAYGENPVVFPMATDSSSMNLCDIHFHKGAEHKAAAFSVKAHKGDDGKEGGYQCGISKSLTAAELEPYKNNQCSGIQAGDTIEVHWVYTSCDVAPGPGLESCLSKSCANPSLRVETQVFTVVNDSSALDFRTFAKVGKSIDGRYQVKSLPTGTGEAIQFLGSTTGPSYSDQVCSPLQVTWSVRTQCSKIDIGSLSDWCAGNEFREDHAHGVRKLVTDPKLLSPILQGSK